MEIELTNRMWTSTRILAKNKWCKMLFENYAVMKENSWAPKDDFSNEAKNTLDVDLLTLLKPSLAFFATVDSVVSENLKERMDTLRTNFPGNGDCIEIIEWILNQQNVEEHVHIITYGNAFIHFVPDETERIQLFNNDASKSMPKFKNTQRLIFRDESFHVENNLIITRMLLEYCNNEELNYTKKWAKDILMKIVDIENEYIAHCIPTFNNDKNYIYHAANSIYQKLFACPNYMVYENLSSDSEYELYLDTYATPKNSQVLFFETLATDSYKTHTYIDEKQIGDALFSKKRKNEKENVVTLSDKNAIILSDNDISDNENDEKSIKQKKMKSYIVDLGVLALGLGLTWYAHKQQMTINEQQELQQQPQQTKKKIKTP
ncbi:hypothetical protein PV326_004884 [Microctonus aethiopoides]|nr:hypothetical protein PV326_004884 [Microctonus aethiopoides]